MGQWGGHGCGGGLLSNCRGFDPPPLHLTQRFLPLAFGFVTAGAGGAFSSRFTTSPNGIGFADFRRAADVIFAVSMPQRQKVSREELETGTLYLGRVPERKSGTPILSSSRNAPESATGQCENTLRLEAV